MDQYTLREYVDQIALAVASLHKENHSRIAGDQSAETNIALLSNCIGNVRHYIHELNTAMNGNDTFLMINAANKDIEQALLSLDELGHKEILLESDFVVLREKLTNLGLLVRSAIDPDYPKA